MVVETVPQGAAPRAISQGGIMKQKVAIVSSSALLGLAAFASPAAAAPLGAGLVTFPATCGGSAVTVTTTSGGGAGFWLGDQHYLLTSIDATAGPGMTFHKDYGHRTGLQGSEIQCTGTLEEPEGTITFEVSAVAVP
jgi:hypothetical protein